MIRILAFVLLFCIHIAFGKTALSTLCSGTNCTLDGTINDEISIDTTYDTIINYATFTNNSTSFIVEKNVGVSTFINYGNMNTFWTANDGSGSIALYNYGTLNSTQSNGNLALSGANVVLHYFNMTIDENASAFNAISGDLSSKADNERNSHILISGSNTGKFSLASDATIMLSFGNSFEVDKAYDMTKLILDCSGSNGNNNITSCNSSYSSVSDQVIGAISTYNDGLYKLNVSGGNLTVSLDTPYASANAIYKSTLLSINTIKNRLNKILYERKLQNKVQNETSKNRKNQSIRHRESEISSDENSMNNYFFFSPFVSQQNIYDGGKYSGLGYGFISGYNADWGGADNHLLGLHFGFMYGEANSDTSFNFKNTYYAGFLGLHYRYNFADSYYLKLRLEAFYHYNTITKTLFDTSNPSSISPSVNVAVGKKWHNGLGIEGGIDYTAMINSKIESIDGDYDKSMFNLAYVDINGNYDLELGAFGLDAMLGGKFLVTPYPKTTLQISGGKDIAIHENRYNLYADIGASWNINEIIALNLNYLGIFGDKMMSNSGFFNVKIWW